MKQLQTQPPLPELVNVAPKAFLLTNAGLAKTGPRRHLIRLFVWSGLVLLWGVPVSAQTLNGSQLLKDYDAALRALPALPNLQFRQQVKVTGTQQFTATLDVLYRQNRTWQAWLAQGDRIRLLDSERLRIVNQSNILELYSAYVSEPANLIPEVTLKLEAPAGRYQVVSVTQEPLGKDSVYHLKLQPTSEGLRELWLDPKTKLPRQALLYMEGVWGKAFVLMQFQPFEQYWLPTQTKINLGYGFWVLSGIQRRDFVGTLTIQHDYQDYKILPEGTALRFSPNQPPVDQAPTVAGTAADQVPLKAGSIQSLGVDASGNQQFSVGLGGQTSETQKLGDRITAFNLTRPEVRKGLTQIDILAEVPLGNTRLPLYLFQFDTGEPIAPIQSTQQNNPPNPTDPFPSDAKPPAIRVLGN